MSDDWAKRYAEDFERELAGAQEQALKTQKRRTFAEAGAGAKFNDIRERVLQDLNTLRKVATFASLELQESSGKRFIVSHRSPLAEVAIELHLTMIGCDYTLSKIDGRVEQRVPGKSKTLRICSDLDGILTVYGNGDEKAFADNAEVSRFILNPVIDFLKNAALSRIQEASAN
jgi:hypothetical protein